MLGAVKAAFRPLNASINESKQETANNTSIVRSRLSAYSLQIISLQFTLMKKKLRFKMAREKKCGANGRVIRVQKSIKKNNSMTKVELV